MRMTGNFDDIIRHFDIKYTTKAYGNGHINDTYLTRVPTKFILQKINRNVFHHPEQVMSNITLVTEHLKKKIIEEGGDPLRETLTVIPATDGKPYHVAEDGEYYRMYVFIENAVSYDSVTSNIQLYHAAHAFGKFQDMLSDFDAHKLYEVIPDFHNTVSRYTNFRRSVENDLSGRKVNAGKEVMFALEREKDASVVMAEMEKGTVPVRVTHNDTKLNNILLDDKTGEGVAVIDLDTVMPGSLLYDFGDALRFAGSSGAEDEPDVEKIWFDLDKFEYFTRGFLEAVPSITETELRLLPFSVKLMTLECGIRFLGDYLDGDTYFKTTYPEHNLVRARTQFKLVSDIEDKMQDMAGIVGKYS